jgi:hypothetical protein
MKRKTTQTRHEDSTHRIAILGLPDLAADAGCTAGWSTSCGPTTGTHTLFQPLQTQCTSASAINTPQNLSISAFARDSRSQKNLQKFIENAGVSMLN